MKVKVEKVAEWREIMTYGSWLLSVLLALVSGFWAQSDEFQKAMSPQAFASFAAVMGGLIAVVRALRFSIVKALEEMDQWDAT